MRLARRLQEAIDSVERGVSLTELWKKPADGYEMMTTKGLVKLYPKKGPRGGKKWFILVAGKETNLGRRASFDHAEGVLVDIGARPK